VKFRRNSAGSCALMRKQHVKSERAARERALDVWRRRAPTWMFRELQEGRGVRSRVAFVTQPILERPGALGAAGAEDARAVDPDLPLVNRWRGGDLSAFGELVRRHQRKVFGLLTRMLGDRDDAEDAAQETFLNLHRHGHRFRSESRFSTFVYRVAVNAALNRRRSQGRRRSHLEEFAHGQAMGQALPSAPREPEEAIGGGEVRARVQRCLQALPEPLRAPVVLYDIEGLSYGEIAEILQVAEGTVKSRIHRARHALRKELADLARELGAAS
jgi:RNA polymerase sigma-70 factor (ECF subfamily)